MQLFFCLYGGSGDLKFYEMKQLNVKGSARLYYRCCIVWHIITILSANTFWCSWRIGAVDRRFYLKKRKRKQVNLLMGWDVVGWAIINLYRSIGSKDETAPFSQLIGDWKVSEMWLKGNWMTFIAFPDLSVNDQLTKWQSFIMHGYYKKNTLPTLVLFSFVMFYFHVWIQFLYHT